MNTYWYKCYRSVQKVKGDVTNHRSSLEVRHSKFSKPKCTRRVVFRAPKGYGAAGQARLRGVNSSIGRALDFNLKVVGSIPISCK